MQCLLKREVVPGGNLGQSTSLLMLKWDPHLVYLSEGGLEFPQPIDKVILNYHNGYTFLAD